MVSMQLAALALAGAAAAIVLLAARGRAWIAGRRARIQRAPAAAEPYVLYFTTDGCARCRLQQEPALAELAGVRIQTVDAIAERELADRYSVYTVPTTVVVAPDGTTRGVNYGFAPARRLREQLSA